jgi:hypothetical protein
MAVAGRRAEMGGQESDDSKPWTECSRGGALEFGTGGASSGWLQNPAGGARLQVPA